MSICLCSGIAKTLKDYYKDQSGTFRVELIQQKSDWYFIYVSRNDSLYKVVSQAPPRYLDYPKLEFHKYYDLDLKSYNLRFLSNPLFKNIEFAQIPPNMIVTLDKENNVSVGYEYTNHIYDWYTSPNIIGLYYITDTLMVDSIRSQFVNKSAD